MSRRVSLIVVLLSSVLVWAADKDFWDTKPYSEWNEKEVEKLLKNSPWSRSVTLSVGTMGGRGSGNESPQQLPRTSGGGGTQTPGGPESDPGGGGQRGPGGIGDPSERPSIPLVVHWYSRPVREAFARRVLLRRPEAPKEQVDGLLNYDDPAHFAILITGFPDRMPGSAPAELVQKLKEETYLQKKNKAKIPLAEVVPPSGPGQPLILKFSSEADGKPALTLEDKEVELVSRLAGDSLRAKFKLTDMVVNGKLEL
jgi:hypothetical protein